MELHLVLKEIVEKEGASILTEPRLVNILADYNAFENNVSARYILRILIEDNYIEELISMMNDTNLYCLKENNIIYDINSQYGIDEKLAKQTISAISFALNIDTYNGNICTKAENEKITHSHITFKSISFDNDLSSFTNELVKKGCEIFLKSEDSVDLEGSFTLIPDCNFTVFATNATKRVYKVLVACPRRSTWLEVYADYRYIKDKLKEKYGKPSTEQENRKSLKKQSLETFERFGCSFYIKEGEIHLDINGFGKFIQLWIVDKINSDLMKTEYSRSSTIDL